MPRDALNSDVVDGQDEKVPKIVAKVTDVNDPKVVIDTPNITVPDVVTERWKF